MKERGWSIVFTAGFFVGVVSGFIATVDLPQPISTSLEILLTLELGSVMRLVLPATVASVGALRLLKARLRPGYASSSRAAIAGVLGGATLSACLSLWRINSVWFVSVSALFGAWSTLAILFPWLRTRTGGDAPAEIVTSLTPN